jgi:hypothetical protein
MSLPWSARQLEWLREMGFEVMARRMPDEVADVAGASIPVPPESAGDGLRVSAAPARSSGSGIPMALQRAARGVDLAPLLAGGTPRDPAARRALWRALRPLRKAARMR